MILRPCFHGTTLNQLLRMPFAYTQTNAISER